MRRVGVLMAGAADDPPLKSDMAARRTYAAELVAKAPDVVLTGSLPDAQALKQVTSTVPIVFYLAGDPVLSGLVASLARPGGNVTGFSGGEPSLGGKWVDLLQQIAPGATRLGIVVPPENPGRADYLRAIANAAQQSRLELTSFDVHDDAQIEAAIDEFARISGGRLLVLPGSSTNLHRQAIIAAAARNRLPAIYSSGYSVESGGLIGYGADRVDRVRDVAGYVDRILRGEKPADLPIQLPTKFELVVNLRTAMALGLAVPPTLLALADEVVE
jgi:putative ABC transport system substrate-binding protein